MELIIKDSTTCTLTLSYKEACLLEALLHNSIGNCKSKEDEKMCKAFWQALQLFIKFDVLIAGI